MSPQERRHLLGGERALACNSHNQRITVKFLIFLTTTTTPVKVHIGDHVEDNVEEECEPQGSAGGLSPLSYRQGGDSTGRAGILPRAFGKVLLIGVRV